MRLRALIDALRDGPLTRAELIIRLGATYPSADSARRMIERDIEHLVDLGVHIQRSDDSPPTYTLRGGAPAYRAADIHTLALIRDSVGPNHPYAAAVAALLSHLTADLSEAQRRAYAGHHVGGAPVQPAIDYGPYAARIAELERDISSRQLLRLRYRNSRGGETVHHKLEPYAIEYYDRHFYLVAYSHNSGQIHDLRVDRVLTMERLHTLAPGTERARLRIVFRYRLAAILAQGELSQRFEAQRVLERLDNGDVIIEAEGRSDFFVIQTLLRYRSNAELLGPPELRAMMAEEVSRLARLYNGDP
jgi:predicted DNA-binding transcriptional regulator YafY